MGYQNLCGYASLADHPQKSHLFDKTKALRKKITIKSNFQATEAGNRISRLRFVRDRIATGAKKLKRALTNPLSPLSGTVSFKRAKIPEQNLFRI